MAKQLKPKSGQIQKKQPEKAVQKPAPQKSVPVPTTPISKLEAEFAKVDANYLNYAANQRVYSENRDAMKKRFSGMNNVFMTQMMMTCASPLRDGLNLESIVMCASMYLGMRAGSKDFRDKTDMAFTKMKYEMHNHAAKKAGPDSKHAELASKYKKQMITQNNGGRYPMTAHSAALTKIAMAQQAYADMRTEGADIDKIMDQYSKSMSALEEQCRDDGVSMRDVNQHMRTYVGQMIQKDPQFAASFNELSYDGISRAPGEPDPNNPNARVWSGQYQDQNGNPFTNGFTPREPLTVESAAARKLDMTIQAYKDMREDGADVLKIQENYDASMAQLSKMCEVDGIDEQAVNRQMRISVGEMARKNPAVMDMFNESTYQGVRRAPYHKDIDGQPVWSGEYMNADGSKFDGAFTPRTVMTEAAAANWKVEAAERAYVDMRNPNMNPAQVADRYNKTDKLFTKWCSADGLDIRDIDRQARMKVGELCDGHPEYASRFYELADSSENAVRPNRDHYDYDHDNGDTVWTGEYVNGRGEEFKGFFSPRVPVDRDAALDHFGTNSNFLFSQTDSPAAFDMAIDGYESAYVQIFGKPTKMPDKDMTNNIAYQYSVMTMQAMSNDSARFNAMDRAAFPTQVRLAMDNAYAKGFENVVSRQFAHSSNYGELAQNIRAYDAAYDYVFGDGESEIADDVKVHPCYQQTVTLMQSMRDSGMSDESIDAAFEDTRVSACMAVDRDVYNAFRTECSFVTQYKPVIEAVDARYEAQEKAQKDAARAQRGKQNRGGQPRKASTRGDIAANRLHAVLEADGSDFNDGYQPDS